MDEPLSNLDAKLRVQTRTEVSRLQRRLGTTMVYVTHDQTEVSTLGDRVAVMRTGVVQQAALANSTTGPSTCRQRLHRVAYYELPVRHARGGPAAHQPSGDLQPSDRIRQEVERSGDRARHRGPMGRRTRGRGAGLARQPPVRDQRSTRSTSTTLAWTCSSTSRVSLGKVNPAEPRGACVDAGTRRDAYGAGETVAALARCRHHHRRGCGRRPLGGRPADAHLRPGQRPQPVAGR